MIIYKIPKFSCKKPYYSLLSSILMLVVSIYVQNSLALVVSIFSIVHHCRTYEDDDHDLVKVFDMMFAILLGISFLQKKDNLKYIISIIFIYIFIQFVKSTHMQSFLHMILHGIVIYILITSSIKQ